MATIFYPNGATKQVKNLGWLLRNWQQVHKIWFELNSDDSKNDGKLIVLLHNGGKYETDFASLTVCFNWLNRPVFKRQNFTIYKKGSVGTVSEWVVGDEKYKQVNKLEYLDLLNVLLGK